MKSELKTCRMLFIDELGADGAEDVTDILGSMERILPEVVRTGNHEEGIRRLKTERFDLVLLGPLGNSPATPGGIAAFADNFVRL